MKRAVIALSAILSACGGTVVQDRPVRVNVPVVQSCALPRPVPVVPLKEQPIDWTSLDVRQKSALVGKQGLDYKTYGEQLSAATAGCP